MPRSLQLGDTVASSTTSMTAATSPWKQAEHARRPTAQSFSAGDFRNQHDHMVAFEEQLDALVGGAELTSNQPNRQYQQHQQHQYQHQFGPDMSLVVRGTLERTISTSSSVSASASSVGGMNDGRAGVRTTAGAKITGRRHRTPRRFVVTDIPDFDEFNSMTSAKHGQPSDDARRATPAQPRPCKMEVKGRFTIIDLSPDSPASSPRAQQQPLPQFAPVSEPTARPNAPRPAPSPRRRVMRKSPSQNSVRLEAPTTPSSASQQQIMYLDPVESSAKARRVDLSVFDRHLDYLQKESAGMKSLLEGMVSTNARWITALNQAGVSFPSPQPASTAAVHAPASPAVLPIAPEPAPARGDSIEEKFAAMELAFVELQKKHELLAAKNKELEAQNTSLETQLRAQTQVSNDLRAQLQHLAQFAGDSDPSNEYASDRMSMFGDMSSVDVDEQSPTSAGLSGDYEYQYEIQKVPVYRRRRRYNEEEECMSDTSSEDSMVKSHSQIFDDEDNNAPLSDPMLPSDDDDSVVTASAYRLTANRVEPHMFKQSTTASALDAMMHDQAAQLRSSLHDEDPALSSDAEAMVVDSDARGGVAALSGFQVLPPSNNQLTHSAQEQPDGLFTLLTRNDSLTSILMNNYSTVSSNSSVASVGIQVAALTKTASGTFVSASGTRLCRAGSLSNQQATRQEDFASLSPESLLFHDTRDKSARSLGLDPHDEDAASATSAVVDSDRCHVLFPQVDGHCSQQQQ